MFNYVVGCDISHWNGVVDYKAMREAGARFVFFKASQGTREDTGLQTNWQGADGLLLRGLYHYLEWKTPVAEQAKFFAGIVKRLNPELPPVLDYEERSNIPSRAVAVSYARQFVESVEQETGLKCMVYTGYYFWMEFGERSDFWAGRPLWIAHYTLLSPKIPAPWTEWTFWQYTQKGNGRYFGTQSKQVDLNYFNGDYDDMLDFARSVAGYAPHKELEVKVVQSAPVFTSPQANAQQLGSLTVGSIFPVADIHVESAMRVWVLYRGVGWVPAVRDGAQYVKTE